MSRTRRVTETFLVVSFKRGNKFLIRLNLLVGIEAFKSDELKHAETKEKLVLPGAEEIQTERTHQGLLQVMMMMIIMIIMIVMMIMIISRVSRASRLRSCAP